MRIKLEIDNTYTNMSANAKLLRAGFLAFQQKKTYNQKWIMRDVLYELLVKEKLISSSVLPFKLFHRTITRVFTDIDNLNNDVGIIRMCNQVRGCSREFGFYFRKENLSFHPSLHCLLQSFQNLFLFLQKYIIHHPSP